MSPRAETTCAEFLERLPLFVGGDLEEDVQAQTTSHLARCEACSEAWRGAVAAREALLSLRGDVTGEGVDLWDGIRTSLRAAEEEATRPAAGRLVFGPWRKALAGAAAAVVVGLLWMQGAGDADGGVVSEPAAPTLADTNAPGAGETRLADTLPGIGETERPGGGLRKRAVGEERLGDEARYWMRQMPVRVGYDHSGVMPVSNSRTSER